MKPTLAEINGLRVQIRDAMQFKRLSDGSYDVLLEGKKVAGVHKGWSRLGGAGWIFMLPGSPVSAAKKSLDSVRRAIADKLSRAA